MIIRINERLSIGDEPSTIGSNYQFWGSLRGEKASLVLGPTSPVCQEVEYDFENKFFRFYKATVSEDSLLWREVAEDVASYFIAPYDYTAQGYLWWTRPDVRNTPRGIVASFDDPASFNLVDLANLSSTIHIVLDERSFNQARMALCEISLHPASIATALVSVGKESEWDGLGKLESDGLFAQRYTVPINEIKDFSLTPQQIDYIQMLEMLENEDFSDPRLHEDQIDAVRTHLSTRLGFVNALATGDGKTIATLVALNEKGLDTHHAIVVLEASVRKQWELEAAEWLDDDWNVVTVASRKDADCLRDALTEDRTLVLCSYNLVADAEHEETDLGQILASTKFHDIILDEGRTIRGSNKTARALWKMRHNSEVGVVLCATPVLKSVTDLAALMAWARCDACIKDDVIKEMFPFDSSQPLDEIENWLEWWGKTLVRSVTDVSKRQSSMAKPKVSTEVQFVKPTATEIHVSNLLVGKIKDALNEVLEAYRRGGGKLDPEEEKQIRGAILATQSVAKMAASDVRILADSDSAIARLLKAEGALEFADTFIPAKMQTCVDLCAAHKKPVVVFTEYRQTAQRMRDALEAKGVATSLFIGGGGAKREEELLDFKEGRTRVLVATGAAERGLNLQNAKTVIHYDHKFTPDAFFQRTGRVTRIGSKYKNVKALFLVTEQTIDERVFSIAVARSGLAGVTAAKSADDFAASDNAEMLRVLAAKANPLALKNKDHVNHLELTQALVA